MHKNTYIAKGEKMGKRRIAALSAAAMLVLPVLSCGTADTESSAQVQNVQSEEGTDAQTQESGTFREETQENSTETLTQTLIPPLTDYVDAEEMELADYWKGSKEDALAKVMKKAARGEKVVVALIGGSITQGTISSGSSDASVADKKCYADIFFAWWEQTFPQTEFEFVNAGIGATDSYLGVHRVEEDVLVRKPDIVLVEFAVNDTNSNFYKKSYDNLVRTIAASENEPAVLLLFMAQTNGAGAQVNQSLVGFTYSLPMVSYGNVIKEMMESGKYSEKELSGDTVHPSALGHAIAGEILWQYLNSVYEAAQQYGEPEAIAEDAVTKEVYTNARILDAADIEPQESSGFKQKEVFAAFPNGWSCEEDGEITFRLSFANLGILYYCQTDGNGGQYEVYVDGNQTAVLDADFQGGWGNYAKAQECFTSDEVAEHEVMIQKKDDSSGGAFSLLGLLVSDGESR